MVSNLPDPYGRGYKMPVLPTELSARIKSKLRNRKGLKRLSRYRPLRNYQKPKWTNLKLPLMNYAVS
ncbi:unnamed protein product [Enterobius vermicularis]|uniref:Transposase n=1 Tax=Enterobius vermicularis TaxID=51028 RepID=A0A0N4UXW3_ENTVE|nr:unnamed protein product [Enterobius vermicularis]